MVTGAAFRTVSRNGLNRQDVDAFIESWPEVKLVVVNGSVGIEGIDPEVGISRPCFDAFWELDGKPIPSL